jgi:N-acetylglucosaminyldiphosphoundecaprenol N-acetyl-beta-D-mannosaminyltransferase
MLNYMNSLEEEIELVEMGESWIKMLGVKFQLLTLDELNKIISNAILTNQKRVIANHNLHSIYVFHHDQKMRNFYSLAYHIHIDGMSLVYLGRISQYPVRREHRVTYLDWIYPMMALIEQENWRVFYLGGKPGVAQIAVNRLLKEYPNLQIEVHHGYFNKSNQENSIIIKKIANFKTNILMVGMGMPLQEHWILENYEKIQTNVILSAGACLDYIAGEIPSPPRWIGKVGFEWLFRLYSEPRRLWRRYLLEPWFIVGLFAKEFFVRR